MEKEHVYQVSMSWIGNKGDGTLHYRAYGRDHLIKAEGKPDIPASSDPSFRGSADRYNPEELLVSSLSSCHMLWYLHLCAVNGVVVTDYVDQARGFMIETPDGGGYFREVQLNPVITVTDAAMTEKALALHEQANHLCFIANSVKFPVTHKPRFIIAPQTAART